MIPLTSKNLESESPLQEQNIEGHNVTHATLEALGHD